MRRYVTFVIFMAVSCLVLACSPGVTPDDQAAPTGPTAGGKSSTLAIQASLTTQAGGTVSQSRLLRLFDATPADKPVFCLMTLKSSSIRIGWVADEPALKSKPLPISGSARIAFYVSPTTASATQRAADDVLLAEYDVNVVSNQATVTSSTREVSDPAMDVLLTNDVEVTTEVTADFNASVEVDKADLTFGDSAATAPPEPRTTDELVAAVDALVQTLPPTSRLTGCWEIKFYPIETTGGSTEPGSVALQVYEINAFGGLERIWNRSPDSSSAQVSDESYRFGSLENDPDFLNSLMGEGYLGDTVAFESFAAYDEPDNQPDISWFAQMSGTVLGSSGELFTVSRTEVANLESYNILGDPSMPEGFVGRFCTVQRIVTTPEGGQETVQLRKIVGSFQARAVPCPYANDPNVNTQEEQVSQASDDGDGSGGGLLTGLDASSTFSYIARPYIDFLGGCCLSLRFTTTSEQACVFLHYQANPSNAGGCVWGTGGWLLAGMSYSSGELLGYFQQNQGCAADQLLAIRVNSYGECVDIANRNFNLVYEQVSGVVDHQRLYELDPASLGLQPIPLPVPTASDCD